MDSSPGAAGNPLNDSLSSSASTEPDWTDDPSNEFDADKLNDDVRDLRRAVMTEQVSWKNDNTTIGNLFYLASSRHALITSVSP
jgi:hypothetical protein